MRPVVFVAPEPLDARTGGYLYNRRIAEGLKQRGRVVDVRGLDVSFPSPSVDALAHAERTLAAIPDGTITVIDSLALGAMPDLVARAAARLRIVALVHLPLAADLSADRQLALTRESGERRALLASALVIVTGAAALPMLAGYALDRPPVLVEPGTDPAPLSRGSKGPEVQLLCAATIEPRKGHEMLIESLGVLRDRQWCLRCAGSLTRHPHGVERLRAAIRAAGLDDRVTLLGELDGRALDDCYDTADVFVLATRQETYCMAVAEALARGLPVVSTRTGAIPSLVGDSAGVIVPSGDVAAFTTALARVIDDGAFRARLKEGAGQIRARLPTWDAAAATMNLALAMADRTEETHGG